MIGHVPKALKMSKKLMSQQLRQYAESLFPVTHNSVIGITHNAKMHTMAKSHGISSKMVSNGRGPPKYESPGLRLSISVFISATEPDVLTHNPQFWSF